MRTRMVATLTIFLFISPGAWAQHDLVKDGNPVSGMTTEQARKKSTNESKERIRIKPTEVPPLIQNTLEQNEFEGWEERDLYYDQSSGYYEVGMDTIHHYLFDEAGRRIDLPRGDLPQPTPEQDTARIEEDY